MESQMPIIISALLGLFMIAVLIFPLVVINFLMESQGDQAVEGILDLFMVSFEADKEAFLSDLLHHDAELYRTVFAELPGFREQLKMHFQKSLSVSAALQLTETGRLYTRWKRNMNATTPKQPQS